MLKQSTLEKLNHVLSDSMWIIYILTVGFVGWVTGLDHIALFLLAIYALLMFIFCNDVKNVLPIAFAVPFFISTNGVFNKITFFIIAFVIFFVGVVYFLIKQLAIKKVKTKKGKMFWATVVYLIAHLLGGIIGYFNILYSAIILGMVLLTYFLYWVALNFTHNLKKYIQYLFIGIGIILSIQLLISYFNVDEPFTSAILSKNVIFIGVQNINIAAIYFVFAMLSVLTLGIGHNKDYLFALASLPFAICTYFTYSRMGMLTCGILFLVAIIYMFVRSHNKPVFLFIGIVAFFIFEIITLVWWNKVSQLLDWYTGLGISGNGRETLYPWCWEQFIENPIFGVGFVTEEVVPTMVVSDHIILAHNTPLQYLTSLGIIGSLMMIYFHVQEYIVACKNFNSFKFMNFLQIMVITIFGFTATKDVFVIIILYTLLVLSENDSDQSIVITPHKAPTLQNQLKQGKKDEEKEDNSSVR